MNMHSSKTVQILIVEDNPTDVALIEAALQKAEFKNALYAVEDGEEALEFLQNQGDYKDVPRPDLILLDLNLPVMDGRELLDVVKNDPDLRRIPIVVLTTSEAENDILVSYNRHANCYILKPLDFHSFKNVVKSIEDFWFSTVVLPEK